MWGDGKIAWAPGQVGGKAGTGPLLWRQKFTNKVSSRFQDAVGQVLLRERMGCPGSGEANTRESLGLKRMERILGL